MSTILVRAKYPKDVRAEELEPLANSLREALASVQDATVQVDDPEDEHRVGSTFLEIVQIVVKDVTVVTGAITLLTKPVAWWMKRRAKEKNDNRPRLVEIFGPDGRVVSRVELDKDAEEPKVTIVQK